MAAHEPISLYTRDIRNPRGIFTRDFIQLHAPEPSDSLTHSSTKRTENTATPGALPPSLLELCRRLEECGIPAWRQGEGLLADLRPPDSLDPAPTEPCSTRSLLCRSLLCEASPSELLDALPGAVVTASLAQRLTLATESGPIDLLPVGRGDLEQVLLNFGLSPYAFAFRPTEERWCDPLDARRAFDEGVLDVTTTTPNPFEIAPRRYWIGARLLAQYALEPSSDLLAAAQAALPGVLERLPQAAPARREVSRILASPAPERGLAFLRMSGVSPALFPGMDPAGESILAEIGPLPALRWAAWLHGTAIQRALVRLRMPPALSRRIERVVRSHPIDRRIESLREVGIRKILGSLEEEEIDGLFRWRRFELAAGPQSDERQVRSRRLHEIEARFEEVRLHRERSGRVRALALNGKAVMAALGAGPGPHVGRALAHLATFIEGHPDSNDPKALEAELSDWAAKNADAIG
jgi:tRNA nucleotidyltransferase (CCA-adding enzyme)